MPADDVRVATAAAYDQIVDEFVRRNTEINDDLFDFRQGFMQAVGESSLVIDVGCGPGRDAQHFRTHGLRVAGFDASAGMARRAHRDGVPVVIADMRTAPVRLGALDGIWSAASLLHVPRAEVPETLVAWNALLRPGGVLGLSTSLGEDEGWERCPYDPTTQNDPDQLRRWFVHHDEHELLGLIRDGGFTVISSRERVSNRRWLQVLAQSIG